MDNILYIDKYLREIEEDIFELCHKAISENKRLHISAPVGTGKTTTIIGIIDKYPEKKILVLFPQISITEQVSNKLNTKGIESTVVNAKSIKGILEQKDGQGLGNVFLSTVDSAYKLIEGIDMDNENTVVILDETHTFMQSPRDNHTKSIEAILKKGYPIIGFSATPSSWVNKFLLEMDNQVEVKFETPQSTEVRQTEIVGGLLRAVAKEIAIKKGKHDIIFMENKKQQERLKEHIQEYNPSAKVCCLNADTKNTTSSTAWKYLMENDKLPDDNDVYIINSVAQAGINITNTNINRVNLVGGFDPFGFAQYLGRCRNYNKEYFYFNSNYGKQLELFDGNKIEKEIEFIQGVLRSSDKEMQEQIKKLISIMSDLIYEDGELNLTPNKCAIAYSVYKELRDLSGEELIYVINNLFPEIEFTSMQPIDGVKVTPAESQRKSRRKALIQLESMIIKEHEQINELIQRIGFNSSEANMEHIINTTFNAKGLKILKGREDKLREIQTLMKKAQVTPRRLAVINSLYRQSHNHDGVLKELINLSNNKLRNINGAMEFFGVTTKSDIKILMKNIYHQKNELFTVNELKLLLTNEVPNLTKSEQLLDNLYKYTLQTKRSNGQLKLIGINESIEEYLDNFNFQYLTYLQGRLSLKKTWKQCSPLVKFS